MHYVAFPVESHYRQFRRGGLRNVRHRWKVSQRGWYVRCLVQWAGRPAWCLATPAGWLPVAMCFTPQPDSAKLPVSFRSKRAAEDWAHVRLEGKGWGWEVVRVSAWVSPSGRIKVASPVG